MSDVIRRMRAGHKTSDIDDTIDEVLNARGDCTTLSERLSGIESEQESQGAALDEDRAALVEIVDSGAKNVRNISLDEIKVLGGNSDFTWVGNVATKNNISFTINSDGTIIVDAVQAASAQVILDIYGIPSGADNVVLSGCPAGGASEKYFLYVKGTEYRDYGDGIVYSKTGAHSIRLVISNGYQPQNLTFKPMICSKAAWNISKKYVPYRPSYDELIARIEALES